MPVIPNDGATSVSKLARFVSPSEISDAFFKTWVQRSTLDLLREGTLIREEFELPIFGVLEQSKAYLRGMSREQQLVWIAGTMMALVGIVLDKKQA